MTEDQTYDVIVIGGGPAGLAAAQYTARYNLKTVVLDKSATAGALAYASKIENYPGLTAAVSGKELLDIFRNQAIGFGAEYIETQVVGVKLDGEIKEIYTLDKTYAGRAVIIATGSMGRKPTIVGEKEFLGRGVSYCAICDAAFYRGKTVCVIGESEEAVKEAGVLTRFAQTVYLIAPGKEVKYKDHPALKEKNLVVIPSHSVKEIHGSEVVEKIRIHNVDTKEEKDMAMDGVFVYLHGTRPVIDFLNYAVDISDHECVTTNKMMEASLPGVFGAGDVTCKEIRQVIIAAADGCIAALSAEKYIRHRTRRRYDWGSS